MSDRWTQRPEGSNWGDFGPDDQIGRMNLLTPERRLKAIKEVEHGLAFCLSLPLDYPGGNVLAPYRKGPVFHYEKRGTGHNFNYEMSQQCSCYTDVVSDDAVTMYLQYSTQWDGLGHLGQIFDTNGTGAEKVYYNGYRAGVDVVGPDDATNDLGAHRLGIENMATAGVQGRGVLVDLHQIYGRERAQVGFDALMTAMERQGASVGPGDFLCLYTGFADVLLEMQKRPDREVLSRSCAVLDGRDKDLLNWITSSEIVAICADNFAVEAYPARQTEADSYPAIPLHEHCIFKLGASLGELWYFRELADWLRTHGRSSFLLTAPPLRLPGAVGSPLTPIATV
ncbi:cyclase family protein [Mycobacterium sp. MMS18-G62]